MLGWLEELNGDYQNAEKYYCYALQVTQSLTHSLSLSLTHSLTHAAGTNRSVAFPAIDPARDGHGQVRPGLANHE